MSINKEGMTYTIIFTFAIAFLFVALLAFANTVTRPQIQQNQEIARRAAVLNAMGVPYTGPEDALQVYEEQVESVTRGSLTLYSASVGGQRIYARIFARNGLWGEIQGVIAVNEDVTEIIGLEIIAHNETPGLGGRIDEAWFKDQFRGLQVDDGLVRVAAGGEAAGTSQPNETVVDAITGATRTSEYMQIIVNTELTEFREALEA